MRMLRNCLLYAGCCVVPVCVAYSAAAQQTRDPEVSSVSSVSPQTRPTTEQGAARAQTPDVIPDSPGTEWARLQQPDSQQTASIQESQAPDATENKTQHPVGTAAAEAPKVTGITAAEPAGVAIAPAKQRRVRTIVLKVGAIIGAGAALGTVVALSAGTSSKPPGAH